MPTLDDVIRLLPWRLQRPLHRARERRADRGRAAATPRDIFSGVYRGGRWGGDGAGFYSGWGSHDARIVEPYVEAVNAWLHGLPKPPDVVDLGCGDFNVGRRIRPACARYVACDVVPELVEHNRAAFAEHDVDFRCLDATADALPEGDVLFVRQVLQHLSNAQIARVVAKMAQFRHVVVTEHLPGTAAFTPNLDKGAGDDVRAGRVDPSAVVLTEPPFGLSPRRTTVLCEVAARGGRVQTLVHAF